MSIASSELRTAGWKLKASVGREVLKADGECCQRINALVGETEREKGGEYLWLV